MEVLICVWKLTGVNCPSPPLIAAFFGTPIALSVTTGIRYGLANPRAAPARAALLGLGIGLIGAFFFGIWGIVTVAIAESAGMNVPAALGLLSIGLAPGLLACVWLTWKLAGNTGFQIAVSAKRLARECQ